MTQLEAPPINGELVPIHPLLSEDAPIRPPGAHPGDSHVTARGADSDGRHALTAPAGELADKLTHPTTPQAAQAWRRWLHLGPDAVTLAEAEQIATMRAQLAAPVSIVVAQPKGGGSKTSVSIGVGSALAAARGGGVAALDNNELSGTLADRVAREDHDRTIGDLIRPPAREGTLGLDWWRTPYATRLQMEWNAHRQPCGLHVYGSDPHMDETVGITHADYAGLHEALARYYPVTIVDTGNSKVAPNWRAAIHAADVIVIPLRLRMDHLLPATRMLEGLREGGHQLDGRVVVAVSNGRMTVAPEARQAAEDWFAAFPMIEVPFDPLIDSPHPILWDRLKPATRVAYNQLGATIMHTITSRES